MATEISWDDERIFDLPNGQLTIDSVPYEGYIVEVENGVTVARDMFVNGMREGESVQFSGGEIVRLSWYRKGALEGPELRFEAGEVVEAKFYARGSHLLTHSLLDGNWEETFRVEPDARTAQWARQRPEGLNG